MFHSLARFCPFLFEAARTALGQTAPLHRAQLARFLLSAVFIPSFGDRSGASTSARPTQTAASFETAQLVTIVGSTRSRSSYWSSPIPQQATCSRTPDRSLCSKDPSALDQGKTAQSLWSRDSGHPGTSTPDCAICARLTRSWHSKTCSTVAPSD